MSAIEVRFVKDSAALLTFSAANYAILKYNIKPAAPEVEQTTEIMELRIRGTTYADARSKWQDLASVVHQVDGYFTNPGKGNEPVYMQFKIESGDNWYRTMLLPGTKLTNANMDIAQRNNEILCKLHLVRTNYFEDTVQTTVVMTNSNGTTTDGKLRTYLCNDGTGAAEAVKEIWMKYPAQTGFDLPSPLAIAAITTGAYVGRLYVGKFEFDHDLVASIPLYHYYEWEDATGDGTPTVDATCSAGDKLVYTLDSDVVRTDKMLFSQKVVAIDYVQGRPLRPFIRFGENTDILNIKVRLRISVDTGDNAFVTPWVIPTNHLICEMPIISFPIMPKGIISPGHAVYYIELDVKRTTSDTETVSVDFIQWMFADEMLVLDMGVSPEANVMWLYYKPTDPFGGMVGKASLMDAGNFYSGWIVLGDKPIMIEPDKAGFLVFCWRDDDGDAGAFGEYINYINTPFFTIYKRRLAL